MVKPHSKEIESPMKLNLKKNPLAIQKKHAKARKQDKENVNVNMKKKVAAPNLKEFKNDENERPFEI